MPTATMNNGAAAATDAPLPLVPFTRGARERVEPFHDKTTTIAASSRQVGPEDVLAHGFLRHLLIEVEGTVPSDNSADVAFANDAPWSALGNVDLLDAAGGNPIVQLSGYELFLANKYGAYVGGQSDPRKSPAYSTTDGTDAAGGNFHYILRVPVEISGRDGLGALKNQNAGQTYKLRYSLSPSDELYTTAPTALPEVRVRAWLESWTQPNAADLFGNPVAQLPPAHGTLQQWSTYVANIESGAQTIRLPRVGNHVRCLVAIVRNSSGVRTAANFPDPVELTYDGNVLDNISKAAARDRVAGRYGFDGADDAAGGLDSGVFVWTYHHDLDGRPGHEMRDLYLPTTQATDLSVRGSFGGSGTLTIVTNDVAARGGIYPV